jgi:hypothetical protein
MAEAGSAVKEFFEAYARATDSADSAFLGSAYGEAFMFASPGTVQAVKRDDFLKVVPKRRAFFAAAGLAASDVRGLEETLLDEHHLLVKARWTFRFERDPARPIIEEGAATYILRRQDKRTSRSRCLPAERRLRSLRREALVQGFGCFVREVGNGDSVRALARPSGVHPDARHHRSPVER